MKAVGYFTPHPIEHPESLLDLELPEPTPGPRDLLVEVRAVSVNPVDTKVRKSASPPEGQAKVLGWDAAGIVRAVGSDVTLFKPGDGVWYAGSIGCAGCNSELHIVDERLVGHMPVALDFAYAAALPLTSITAWEMLFERLGIVPGKQHTDRSLLIIGAAGGVGSILVQLARRLTGLTIIGTASRPQSRTWVEELGAHHVIDHSQPLTEEFKRHGLAAPNYVVSLTHTDQHFKQIVELIAPQGKIGLIDDPAPGSIDVGLLKRKSLSLHWELMFTRALFETPDMIAQHHLLNEIGQLVNAGVITTTLHDDFGQINAENLRLAHTLLESGQSRGKIVLDGF